MPIVLHKFRNHIVSNKTEILILGTFNPDVVEGPDFFYGRPRNYLWQLLPGCWHLASLKDSPLIAKRNFMNTHKIDFADIIHSVDVPPNQVNNVNDTYIDGTVENWKNIIHLIGTLPHLQAVYFTRITFNGIPNIRQQIRAIRNYCSQNSIRFCLLKTPSRFANAVKQQQWIDTIINQNKCSAL